jgi:hypothetical protein
MSWFFLKDQEKKYLRKGICLRVENMSQPVVRALLDSRCLPDGALVVDKQDRVSVDPAVVHSITVAIFHLLPKGRVTLRVSFCTYEDRLRYVRHEMAEKYTVFYVETDEDPDWTCEGDIGRGLVRKSI